MGITPAADSEDKELLDGEKYWRDHHDWLLQSGYQLRPRYRPGWVPSWKGTNKIPLFCEDGLYLKRPSLIDAVRVKDGEMVVFKRVSKSVHPYEVEIGRFLTSPPLSDNPRNHCCRILEVLQDPRNPDIQIIVMPFLRSYNQPKFATVGEAVEFFRQAFEGLQFMHEHRVAHRDAMSLNILMDAKPLLPNMWHFVAPWRTRDFKKFVRPGSRTAHPVKYYWADFGLSRRYSPDDPNPMEYPILGGDKSVPEFEKDPGVPCNPFPTDVYYVGNLIREDFLKVFKNLTFMEPLVTRMVDDDPSKRPTMDEVVSEFKKISSQLSKCQLRSRLLEFRDTPFSNFLKDVYHTSTRSVPHFLMRRSPLPSPKP
ncbi:hypothetical protein C8T65DRAFT_739950 [Cerioporus squamosus]|nr:hypothetical protein C8T65DRAFT_739950 [Cerioporus squamosus]